MVQPAVGHSGGSRHNGHNGHNGQRPNSLMNDLKIPENGIQMMYQLVVAVEIIHNATR
jgi:hypothetical protein